VNNSEVFLRASHLAEQALYLSHPNPRVGCLLLSTDGLELGAGYTQQAGGPHAEIMALRDAQALGHDVHGATAYVTLEPCSHHGRTPPCCDALIAAGIKRVVVSTLDPNPLVAGQGIERLRAEGISVEVLPADSENALASRELNIGFFSRMIRGRPWVRMKVAASLDGVTALTNKASQWITGPAARADGHAWRGRACAVLTGIGTVLEDNPMMDVRELVVPRQPHLVIVDSRLQTPLDARLFNQPSQGLSRQILIYSATLAPDRTQALQARGATVVHLPSPSGKVDLSAMLLDLSKREVNELHLEAGTMLNGSFLREGLVDEVLLYLAPRLLGMGSGLSNLGALERLADGIPLRFKSVEALGDDLRVLARVLDRDAFLLA